LADQRNLIDAHGLRWGGIHCTTKESDMNNPLRTPLLLAVLSATAFGASIASAQEQETPSPATEAQATAPKSSATAPIDEKKIEQFADAYVAVQTIQTKAAKDLDSPTADPAKQQQTQAAVENEMIAAVERSGLKLEEFNSIVQTMTADADLRARVVAEIRERTGG
jgi:hypothetical protein